MYKTVVVLICLVCEGHGAPSPRVVDDGKLSGMQVEVEEVGVFGALNFSMTFKSGQKVISPWHDAPLLLAGGLYNMLVEIPRMTREKMEVHTKVEGNPIKQDEKKGKPRLYHSQILWNYGCFPQTWEDPSVQGDAAVDGAFGDGDPLDVVDIGSVTLRTGSFTPVKVLGALAMIDNDELDWKVIAINTADVHAEEMNDVGDIEKLYPGTVSGLREWFRMYKTPEGKPENRFGYGEKALGAAEAKKVIQETREFHAKLLSGETDAGKLWVPAPPTKATTPEFAQKTESKTAPVVAGPAFGTFAWPSVAGVAVGVGALALKRRRSRSTSQSDLELYSE